MREALLSTHAPRDRASLSLRVRGNRGQMSI